jgi:hypothetical protein
VLLSTSTLNLRIRGKLTSKFVGPFEVMPRPAQATNPNVVWLKVPRTFRIHMPINVKEIVIFRGRRIWEVHPRSHQSQLSWMVLIIGKWSLFWRS